MSIQVPKYKKIIRVRTFCVFIRQVELEVVKADVVDALLMLTYFSS
jgi:hypothetical protein